MLSAEPYRLTGAWTSVPRRIYDSPSLHGSGVGPYVDAFDVSWDGVFEGEIPLAGIALFRMGGRWQWAKSSPAVARPSVSLKFWGWRGRPEAIHVGASFHGARFPLPLVNVHAEPSSACKLGEELVVPGVPHVVASIEDIAFAIVVLPGTATRVGRNRLWRLRDQLAPALAPELRALLTHRSCGELR